MRRHASCFLRLILVALAGTGLLPDVRAAEFRVFVVMSYEATNPWVEEIEQGIAAALGRTSATTYYYLNTRQNLAGGHDRAREAFEIYKRLRPDGIIAADDNAQTMFVVPYLKNKVKVPVVFCGVNTEAEVYGYPSKNVTGILERGHIHESVAFMKQLMPSIERIAFITKEGPAARALESQVESEREKYGVRVTGFHQVKSMVDLLALGNEISRESDAVYMDSIEEIQYDTASDLKCGQVIGLFSSTYGLPVIGANRCHIDRGALGGVIKTGQEQGELAGKHLLRAMRGTPVAEIPITQNHIGRRMINVSTLEALGIEPRPIVLRGATLVRGR